MANYANTARFGDPLSPGWQENNLSWIEPIKGQRWQVYKGAQTAFEGLLNDLIKLGYHPTSSGGFNYRNIRGGDTLSQHAFGNAIDLNSMTNAMGQSATDIPHAAELAKKWGLEWGGNWKGRPDPMHFEWTGGGGAGDAQMNAGGMGPPMPKSITNWSPEQRRNAIASIESAGSGDYKALGKQLGGPHGGDRAYGRYQIMGANIPKWSKEVLGRAVTPDEFLNDPKIQDAIFDAKFGDYVRRFGEESAAQAWFGGEGSIGKTNLKDALGTDLGSYGQKYLAALTGSGAPSGDVRNYPDQQTPAAVAANQPVTGPTGQGDGKKDGFDFDAFTANLGGLLPGSGGSGGAGRSMTQVRAPQVTPTINDPLTSSTALTPEQAQARLQLALTRLNSGKLV